MDYIHAQEKVESNAHLCNNQIFKKSRMLKTSQLENKFFIESKQT